MVVDFLNRPRKIVLDLLRERVSTVYNNMD